MLEVLQRNLGSHSSDFGNVVPCSLVKGSTEMC
jgi:hypothetical protein